VSNHRNKVRPTPWWAVILIIGGLHHPAVLAAWALSQPLRSPRENSFFGRICISPNLRL